MEPASTLGLGATDKRVLLLVLGLALALRAIAIAPEHLHRWDEAYHALVAKHLAQHPFVPTLFDDPSLPFDDRDWQRAHVFLNKPPMTLWLMALSLSLFGDNAPAARFPSLVLDMCGVLLTFALGSRLFGKSAGLWAAAFHAVSPGALLLASGVVGSDHVNVHLAFWVEFAMYALVRLREGAWAWSLGVAGASGAAYLTKGPPGLLPLALLPVACLPVRSILRTATLLVVAGAGTALIATPWSAYAATRWPVAYAAQLSSWLHATTAVEGHQHHVLYHLERAGELHGFLVYVPLGCFLYRAVKDRGWSGWIVAAWWVVPLLVFTASATKLTSYMFVAAPAVYLMEGDFAARIAEERSAGRRRNVWRGIAVAVAVGVLVMAGIALRRALQPSPGYPAFVAAMQALPDRTVLTGVSSYYYADAMFFGAHAAYPERWDSQMASAIEAKGYRVVELRCSDEGMGIPKAACAP